MIGLLFFLQTISFSKEAQIRWKSKSHAVSYELKIFDERQKLVYHDILTSPFWKGVLSPGIYFYQIKGIDRSGQKGRATKNKLILLPEAPKKNVPSENQIIPIYGLETSVHFKWDQTPSESEKVFELRQSEALLQSKRFSSRSLSTDVSHLKEGSYCWSIQSSLSSSNESWKTKTPCWSFSILTRPLEKPHLLFPLSVELPSPDQMVTLRWEAVQGAKGYRVRLKGPETIRSQMTESLEARFSVDEGVYYDWGVEAYSSPNDPNVFSPQALGRFKLDRNCAFHAERSFLSIPLGSSLYSYRRYSSLASGSLKSSALTFGIRGEHWFTSQWAWTLWFQGESFSVSGFQTLQSGLGGGVYYRMRLGVQNNAMSLYLKSSLRLQSYARVAPLRTSASELDYSQSQISQVWTLGPHLSFELKKPWGRDFRQTFSMGLFQPLSLLGGSSQDRKLQGGLTPRNWLFSLQNEFSLSTYFEIHGSFTYETRSLSTADLTGSFQEQLLFKQMILSIQGVFKF